MHCVVLTDKLVHMCTHLCVCKREQEEWDTVKLLYNHQVRSYKMGSYRCKPITVRCSERIGCILYITGNVAAEIALFIFNFFMFQYGLIVCPVIP